MGADRVLLGIGVTPVVVKSTWALWHASMCGSQEAKNQCRSSNKGKLWTWITSSKAGAGQSVGGNDTYTFALSWQAKEKWSICHTFTQSV